MQRRNRFQKPDMHRYVIPGGLPDLVERRIDHAIQSQRPLIENSQVFLLVVAIR